MKNTKIFLSAFLAIIFLALPAAAKKSEKINKGIENLQRWNSFEFILFSWIDAPADTVVSTFGIPTQQFKLETGNAQFEYIEREVSTTTSITTRASSYYSNFLDTVFTTSTSNSTTKSNENINKITFVVKNGKVSYIGYDGDWLTLSKMLGGRLAPDFKPSRDTSEKNAFFTSNNMMKKTWQDMTVDELFWLERYSANYGGDSDKKEFLYNSIYDQYSKGNSKKKLGTLIEAQENNLAKNGYMIEHYIACVLVYSDLFGVEKFKGCKDRFVNSKEYTRFGEKKEISVSKNNAPLQYKEAPNDGSTDVNALAGTYVAEMSFENADTKLTLKLSGNEWKMQILSVSCFVLKLIEVKFDYEGTFSRKGNVLTMNQVRYKKADDSDWTAVPGVSIKKILANGNLCDKDNNNNDLFWIKQ